MAGAAALAAAALPLGGCVAGMAASAAGMAVRAAQKPAQSNAHLQPEARSACAAHAAQYGAVHVIDVEQRRADRIIVWGTVETTEGRRSFECRFTKTITGFVLREIRAPR